MIHQEGERLGARTGARLGALVGGLDAGLELLADREDLDVLERDLGAEPLAGVRLIADRRLVQLEREEDIQPIAWAEADLASE